MSKIGILSMYRYPNYGAVLQCWALKQACNKLGYDTQIINYYPWGEQKLVVKLTRPTKFIRSIIDYYLFKRFIDKHCNLTEFIGSHEDILNHPPYEDVYVAGSDQIWSPKIVEDKLNSYLLDFVPNTSSRIAYASSMGGVPYTESKELFVKELPKFSAIGLREPEFVTDISKISGLYVTDVCDPSLLLTTEDYLSIEKKKYCLPKHYIAVMKLIPDPFLEQIINVIKQKTNLPIVTLMAGYRKGCDHFFLSLSPQKWLYVMRNADYIVTDSFHGTAFSIIFRKPFVCIYDQVRVEQNDRITNILNQTGLVNQIVSKIEDVDNIFTVDYSKCEKKIQNYRARSLTWLKNALEKAINDKNNK